MSGVHYSRGRNINDNRPVQRQVGDFAELVATLDGDRAAQKAGAGYICGPLNGDGRRSAEGALPRRWLAVDLDRIEADSLGDVLLWFARFSGCGWPTHSSTLAAPRQRVLIELDREATRAECIRIGQVLMRDLADEFGDAVLVDDSTFRGEQPVFVPPKDVQLSRYLGDPLEVDRYLTAARVDAPIGASTKTTAHDAAGSTIGAGGRNKALTRLAGKLRRDGLSALSIEAALLQANVERCSPPLDNDEVRAIARSVGRYAPQADPMRDAQPAGDPREAPPEDDTPTWPEPMLPGAVRVPEIGADVLGGWMGRMAEAVAASTQTPQAMSVLSMLSVLAAVLQRRFEVAPYGDDYREPLSLWTVVALGSGNRKTAVHKAVTGVLVDWEKRERDRLRGDIARTYAQREVIGKRIETLKAQAGKEEDTTKRQALQDEIAREREQMPAELHAPRLFSGDITAERLQQLLVEQDERGAIITDEGGVFQIMAGAYSGGLSSIDVFLQGHSGSSMRVDRAGRMAHLDRPALTLALALQPGILHDVGKTKRFRDSGLMARCLYGVPRSTLGTRDVRDRHPLPEDVRDEYEHHVFALLDGMRRPIGAPRVLPFTDEAREAWLDLCQRIEGDLGEGGRLSHMADWASKLPGAAARVAGLLALAEHGTTIDAVPLGPVQRAVRLADALVPHAEAAFALMGAADGETDAQAVLDYIRRHQPELVVRRDLQKAMEGRFRSLDRLMVAIKLLQDWQVLGRADKTTGTGRPSIFYPVNPRSFVDKSVKSHRSDSDPSSSSQY